MTEIAKETIINVDSEKADLGLKLNEEVKLRDAIIDELGRSYATGKRKNAIAKAQLTMVGFLVEVLPNTEASYLELQEGEALQIMVYFLNMITSTIRFLK